MLMLIAYCCSGITEENLRLKYPTHSMRNSLYTIWCRSNPWAIQKYFESQETHEQLIPNAELSQTIRTSVRLAFNG